MTKKINRDHSLVRKRDAAQATLDQWSKRPFRIGSADCVRMTASHLRRLGYRVKLPPSGSYRTLNSAMKLLRAAGFDGLAAAIDATGLERIAPAATVVGDIMLMPSDHPMGALAIVIGNGRILGWTADAPEGATVLQPLEMITAWRVMPKGS